MGAIDHAIGWFKQLNTLLHETDPGVAAKLGDLFARKGEDNVAYLHYHDVGLIFSFVH